MKTHYRILPLLLLFVFPFHSALAQFQAGLAGGINGRVIFHQNNYGFSKLEYTRSISGTAGAFVGYKFGKHSLNLEVNMLNLGQGYKEAIDGQTFEKDIRLSYLQIPLVFNLGLSSIENKSPYYLAIGAYFSSLNKAEVKWSVDETEVSMATFQTTGNHNPEINVILPKLSVDGNPTDDKELYNSSDMGVILGLGKSISLGGSLRLLVELRGGYGLADINADDWHITRTNDPYKKSNNGYGGLRLALSFGGGSVNEE